MAVIFIAGIAFAFGAVVGFCIGRDVRNREIALRQARQAKD